jgi:putative Holliday junction resolvase
VAETEAMIERLKKSFGLPVVRADERFTSAIAARSLVEAGVKKSDRRKKEIVDRVSAVLILQSYMDRRR